MNNRPPVTSASGGFGVSRRALSPMGMYGWCFTLGSPAPGGGGWGVGDQGTDTQAGPGEPDRRRGRGGPGPANEAPARQTGRGRSEGRANRRTAGMDGRVNRGRCPGKLM